VTLKNKIWILTEERPKREVIEQILTKFATDQKLKYEIENLKIKPIVKTKKFCFEYIIEGITIQNVESFHLFISSGAEGSFVDYLIFYQQEKPKQNDNPIYVIEETKTTPAESRNVSVYQRTSKFVFVEAFDHIIKNAEKIMLYSIRTHYNTIPNTFVFGIKAMRTLGVTILGFDVSDKKYSEFKDLDELITLKNSFATKRNDNIPVSIKRGKNNTVIITGKLEKSGTFSHDPNMGAISILAKLVRKLDHSVNDIIVTRHGLSQKMVDTTKNKFVKIANKLKISLHSVSINATSIGNSYWKYSITGEKIVSVFFHILLDYCDTKVIYENHAGCEQGYFEYPDGKLASIEKLTYKPDIIFIDNTSKIIYLIEAETADNVFKPQKGVKQLPLFDTVEKEFCSEYIGYSFERKVILYGDNHINLANSSSKEIIFQLKTDGSFICFPTCPPLIKSKIQKINS